MLALKDYREHFQSSEIAKLPSENSHVCTSCLNESSIATAATSFDPVENNAVIQQKYTDESSLIEAFNFYSFNLYEIGNAINSCNLQKSPVFFLGTTFASKNLKGDLVPRKTVSGWGYKWNFRAP